MLASVEKVNKAMSLNLSDIRIAMSNGGEPDVNKEILSTIFLGFNGSRFVYEISYSSPEYDAIIFGRVFVELRRQPFSHQFEFIATT